MRHDPEAFRLVNRKLDALAEAIEKLQPVLKQIGPHMDWSGGALADLEWACEQVTAAADALVAAIERWIPSLVPTPRALDEVLATIASWQPNEQTERAANSAAELFEQLHAESYSGESELDPAEFPNLEEFIEDLRATVDVVWDALP